MAASPPLSRHFVLRSLSLQAEGEGGRCHQMRGCFAQPRSEAFCSPNRGTGPERTRHKDEPLQIGFRFRSGASFEGSAQRRKWGKATRIHSASWPPSFQNRLLPPHIDRAQIPLFRGITVKLVFLKLSGPPEMGLERLPDSHPRPRRGAEGTTSPRCIPCGVLILRRS